MLLLSTQLSTAVTLAAQGINAMDPSQVADERILSTAFEVISDVVVQAGGLTAFRIYRWADAQQYRR